MIPGTQVDGGQAASAACELAAVEVEEGCPIPGITHEAAAHATIRIIATAMARTVVNPVWALGGAHGFLLPRLDNIPDELRAKARWVTWLAEGAPGQKPRKVPYNPTLLHTRASSTDPDTWGTFAQVDAAFSEGGRTGVGIVLNGDGLVGIDIDHCVENGVPDAKALELMSSLGAQYVELSPSGTGLRAFGYSDGLATGCKGKYTGLDVELYSTERYLTVTGVTISDGAIAPLTGFNQLADRIRSDREINPETGELERVEQAKRHAELFRRVLSGEVYHDSLRDLAASMVASGMGAGAVVNLLYGLFDNSAAEHDDRWKARRDEIPKLVSSASAKFGPELPSSKLYLPTLMTPSTLVETPVRFSLMESTAATLFIGESKEVEWLVEDTLPTAKVIILASPPGVGKSFMSLDLAVAVTAPPETGTYRCFGGEVKVKGRAVIISAEDDVEELHRRIEALTQLRSDRLHVASLPDLGHFSFLQGDPRSGFTPTAKWTDLKEQTLGLGDVKLIIVDTLQALSAGDLNAAEIAQAMMDQLTELASRTGASVIALHHLTKGTGLSKGRGLLQGHAAMELIRGSGAIVGSARAAYCLFPHPNAVEVCETLGEEHEDGKVVYGLVAKANGKARRTPVIYVRDVTGVLRDRTRDYSGGISQGEEENLEEVLLEAVLDAYASGKGYAVSGESKGCLHKRRRELAESFHDKSANWFAKVVEALIAKGLLRKESVTNGAKLAPPVDDDWDNFEHC